MGLFDLASPALDFIRLSLLSGLPGAVQIALIALVSAVVTMGLYVLCSNQDRIEKAKNDAKAARKELSEYDGEPDGLGPVAAQSVKASFKHLGYTLWPALLASLPILFILVWLSNTYSYHPPEPGAKLAITVHPAEAELITPSLMPVEGEPGAFTLVWSGTETELFDGNAAAIATLPVDLTFAIIHKKGWFNALFANPLGYIPDDSPVEAVEFELKAINYLGVSPGWLGGWEMIYFTLLIAGSLAIKFIFKVN